MCGSKKTEEKMRTRKKIVPDKKMIIPGAVYKCRVVFKEEE